MSQPALLPYDPSAFLTAAAIFLCCLFPSHIRSKMASGVPVADGVKELINSMKVLKNDADVTKRIRLVVFSIMNDCIDVERTYVEKDLEGKDVFSVFKELLDPKICRYILYDCHFETKESSKKEELVYCLWCPDTAKIKDKMCYAASNDAVKKCMGGVKHNLQLNDIADCNNRECLAEKLGKNIVCLEGLPCGYDGGQKGSS